MSDLASKLQKRGKRDGRISGTLRNAPAMWRLVSAARGGRRRCGMKSVWKDGGRLPRVEETRPRLAADEGDVADDSDGGGGHRWRLVLYLDGARCSEGKALAADVAVPRGFLTRDAARRRQG
ncbi:hypothetical protein E2562_014928 [Oryza meyeriana var. granulata]|uniref:Uncharacterized protein n=1 Tax=Oryza meyeriana var. granulata TaxID=110450 RepID=A0A6G1EJ99_9ORYZ|nr:hypothetical protein E2562_014928 [Oryza meyeriana var. granulata]